MNSRLLEQAGDKRQDEGGVAERQQAELSLGVDES